MMSLPASQQRTLDRIEKTLAHDHPGLGPLFAIFTKLVSHEAMPMTERVTARRSRPRSWRQLRPAIATLVGLGVAVVVLFALSLTLPSSQGCPGSVSTAAARMSSVPAGRVAACTTQQYKRGGP
jgi:hypothetical protein